MTFARTYYMNKTSDAQFAQLLSERRDFYLENVEDMQGTLRRAQALLERDGLTSRILDRPSNPGATLHHSMLASLPIIGIASTMLHAATTLAQPRADVTFVRTAEESLSVVFGGHVVKVKPRDASNDSAENPAHQ